MNGKCITIPKVFGTNEANEFRKNLIYLISKGNKNFVVDFSKCEFIDVTGLGVLISIHNKCNKVNGSLKLCSINSRIAELFKFTRIYKILNIECG